MNVIETRKGHKIKIGLMTYAVDGRPAKGTALVARKHIQSLLAARDVFDLTFIHYDSSEDPIYKHGVREIIIPSFRLKLFNRRSLRQIYFFLKTKEKFDIIHWFQPRLYPFFWLAPSRHIVVTVHAAGDIAAPSFFNLARVVFNWTLRIWKKRVSAAIAVSDFAKDEIVKHYGIPSARVYGIHNGVDEKFFSVREEDVRRVREKYALPSNYFLNIARLVPHKNVPRLIRAFLRLASMNGGGSNINLVNVGSRGYDRPEIDRILARNNYARLVHFIDYAEDDDLPALYAGALALVFPSLHEGFGLPVIEAMAAGTPVITSCVASLPEVSGGAAILVDPYKESEIADAMKRITEDESLRKELIQKGLMNARKFSWDESGKKLIELYQKVCGEP